MTGGPANDEDWRDVHARLSGREELTATELDQLAEALFWLDRPFESAAVWHRAHDAHLDAGDVDAAIRAAWRAFFEHYLVREMAVASGWLERQRALRADAIDPASAGLVALAESSWAVAHDDLDGAATHARQAVEAGRAAGDLNLHALATEFLGRCLVAAGRVDEGIRRLDEAMVSVIGGRLAPLHTGWIYCEVLSVCRDLADLRRASEWTDAAMRWCDDLREGSVYPGTCRVHRAELACLRGAWDRAEVEVRRACDELTRFDPRYAGEAHYLAGELCRLRGDLAGAETAYARAHELGRPPQPGLALLRLSQGQVDQAVAALRMALEPGPTQPLPQARLLVALVEAELRGGSVEQARAAADRLVALAGEHASHYLEALAAASDGTVRLAEGRPALPRLRRAHATFVDLGLPFDAAQVQVQLGMAARRAGDSEGARLELGAARAAFERLGAASDVAIVSGLLARPRARPGGLTNREVEVLREVAKGRTDREIGAELSISEHTVARHVSNIRTKLGVPSRAAATAFAIEHDLI